MPSPTQAEIYDRATQFKDDLIANERRASARIVDSYGRAFDKMKDNIRVLTEKIERARAAGQYISPSWAFQIDRYLTLQRQITSEVTRIAGTVEQTITTNQTAAVQQAVANTGTLIEMGAQSTGVSVSFSQLPTAATESIVGFLSDGSPLKGLLDKLPGMAGQAVAEALTDGITRGLGATKIASNIRNALGGNMTRAMTIARTETMRAYREATSRTFNQNRDILVGWVWVASFSRRTCASCLALAGSVHRLDERMESHPRCRCVAQPLLRGQAVTIQKGDEWFATQPEEIQRAILGSNVAVNAYRDGRVTLTDFVGRQNSPQWGQPYYQLSTKRAILKQSKFPGYNQPTEIFPLEQLFTLPEPPAPASPPVPPTPAAPVAPTSPAPATRRTRKPKADAQTSAPATTATRPRLKFTSLGKAHEYMRSQGIARFTSFSGLRLSQVNDIVNDLTEIWSDWNLDPLLQVTPGAPGQAHGSAHGKMILFNAKLGKKDIARNAFQSEVTHFSSKMRLHLQLVNRTLSNSRVASQSLKDRQSKLMELVKYKRWGAAFSEKTFVSDVFVHESGHVVADQLLGFINPSLIKNPDNLLPGSAGAKLRDEWTNIFNKRKKEKYKISAYANENVDEYFAECFLMYKREPQNLPPKIRKYFDRLKEYAKK